MDWLLYVLALVGVVSLLRVALRAGQARPSVAAIATPAPAPIETPAPGPIETPAPGPIETTPPQAIDTAAPATAPASSGDAPDATGAGAPDTLQSLAQRLEAFYEASSHPSDLATHPAFQAGVRALVDPQVPVEQVVAHCNGANPRIAAMAAAALAERPDSAASVGRVLLHLPHAYVWTTYFALRYIDRRTDRPAVCAVLLETPKWWVDNPVMPQLLGDFIDARIAHGERPDLARALDAAAPDNFAFFEAMLAKLATPRANPLRAQLDAWRATRVDREFLRSIGRLADETEPGSPVVVHERLEADVKAALESLLGEKRRSVAFVGEPGVGKSAQIRTLAARLHASGWTVFEATAADVLAGAVYIGELEERLKRLMEAVHARRRVVWHVPNMHELFYAGRHRFSPVGMLDLLMPAIEAGRLVIVGESEPASLEKVLQQRPRVRSAFRIVAVEAMPVAAARALAAQVVANESKAQGVAPATEVVDEALELARHYLAARALPGSVIDLLRNGAARHAARRDSASLDRSVLLESLAEMTGLPREVLDDRTGLAPQALRAHFEARVMGQPEAVNCLVDRIAMLKAGLVDPNRPIGVFLFAGPTGTGKTEVAKTLAAFLFGSADRMVRLDMSEFQDLASFGRIVGDTGEGAENEALTSRIRKQPFAVVLLDEFEKAHPRIWDIFLQVFDDGRLTDAQGRVADFRHAIVIMTSNLGATAHRGSSLGFIEGGGAFGESQVLRAIGATFRPEFVNRIDRVVVFRPLSKAVMRDILRKELRNVLQRRGFRSREWAVEWEDSAIEFLLEKGFTPDMGARPLRRAIDEYVLAPIAMTIVEHRFPEGDQFLFVRSDGESIQVEFVDPDAASAAEPAPVEVGVAKLSWGSIILAPAGTMAERAFVRGAFETLEARLDGEAWSAEKGALLGQINQPDFWTRNERHATLDRLERMDRLEAGLETARSLARRLDSPARGRAAAPASIVASLGQQLYLLEAALRDLAEGRAADVYLAVDPVIEDRTPAASEDWAARVAQMYRAWAKRRRMRIAVLAGESGCNVVLAIGGFGAHGILEREAGLHVLEVPAEGADFARHAARVRVVAQPTTPAHRGPLEQAQATLATAGPAPTAIVRRYRRHPSPLVRDAAAGWRSGRLDLVLGGDFDLMA